MSDVFSKEKRSEVMSKIRGKRNKSTELKLIEIMRSARITGWRRNQKVFGNPDFVFPKKRLAVFVDGCFWHKCPEHFNLPKANRAVWKEKISKNQERDAEVVVTLRNKGWKVIRIWEHELKFPADVVEKLKDGIA